jgi:hypothetical protein
MQRSILSKLSVLALATLMAGCPSGKEGEGSPPPATTGGATGAATVQGASGAATTAPGASGAAATTQAASGEAPAKPAGALFTPRPRNFEAKGVYFTATSVEMSSRWKPWLTKLKNAGGNMVLFDAKDEDGIVQWQSTNKLCKEMGASKEGPIRDLKAKVKEAHDMGIHVAGRVCCFHDPILAKKHPELAPRHVNGGIWKELGSQAWVDPSKEVAQDYIIDLGKELVSLGVDEVQLDYIRFPAMGDTQNARYAFDPKNEKKIQKHEIITAFAKKAYDQIHPTGALMSCDVYGIMAWAQPIDVKITGQLMEDMCKHMDVVCPMDYPSHFSNGFDGIAHPADQPYMFVNNALRRLTKKVEGTNVTIRPWLQGMPYKVSNFNAHYITEQLKAAEENHATGYMFWNAQNTYETVWAGMTQWNSRKH